MFCDMWEFHLATKSGPRQIQQFPFRLSIGCMAVYGPFPFPASEDRPQAKTGRAKPRFAFGGREGCKDALEEQGCGCQNRFGIPFWGKCTTYFGGDWDVHWGYGTLTHGPMSRNPGAPPRTGFTGFDIHLSRWFPVPVVRCLRF